MNPFAAPRHKPGMGAIPRTAAGPSWRWLKIVSLTTGLLLMSAFIFLAPVLWLAWLDPFGGPRHPSDAELIAQLASHHSELEQVVAMAREDAELRRLAADFTRPENPADAGVTAARI